MLDSIHVGRWLEQFHGEDVEFVLYPSKKFRSIHPKIRKLLDSSSETRIRLVGGSWKSPFYGYWDFATRVIPFQWLKLNLRLHTLIIHLRMHGYDYVHCLELQGAGYLLSNALPPKRKFKVIITNWGSDIYYYRNIPRHREQIIHTLKSADYYSAECVRDYELAFNLGFHGESLPCIPNAGGFAWPIRQDSHKSSQRKKIIVKSYGGKFGRGQFAIAALSEILLEFDEYTVFLYSVTADLLHSVKELEFQFQGRVSFSIHSDPVDQDVLMNRFLESRIYIGCSVSDGISTSFLQSLVCGTYPIQTNTSCASEWLAKGAIASIIDLNLQELIHSIRAAIEDDNLVDQAQIANETVARDYLRFEVVKKNALKFYSL